ncbi:hypothetical protein H0H93_013402 [Arthromyces matolae]|nr:hypothetical protein H0H93_013402 [Arthromyces matolae]
MAFPAPDTLYRIQSVDFNTCLELYDVSNEAVVLRSIKETELQQWLFIKQRSGNTYKILAAATQALSSPRYLTLTDIGEESQPRPLAPPTAVKDSSSVTHWHLYKENDGSFIMTTKVENANNEGYLRLVDRGLRWEITEFVSEEPVSPSSRYPEINEREYAIRNLGTGDYWGFISGFHARAGPLKSKQLTVSIS